ncbi:MAG: DNA-binding protein [Candidatus Avelusimicrobium sp.]
MIKLTKAQKEKLKTMPTFEQEERAYFAKHPEELAEYRKAALEEYTADKTMTAKELLAILRHIAKLEGYTHLAKRANLKREHLYRAISPTGNPTLSTMEKLASSCGLRVGFIPK